MAAPARRATRPSRPGRRTDKIPRRSSRSPEQKKLYCVEDHGLPRTIDPRHFVPLDRGGGWGSFAEPFLRMNEGALAALDVRAELGADREGPGIRLLPGGRTGAVPLRSPQTGQVAAGFVVRPRFGWAGVGSVLAETGWHAAPEFLDLPLVPGSGREVPPWVLAGPVLSRLAELLRTMRPGYREIEVVSSRPRGRVLWQRYVRESLAYGQWHRLPCRFPDLETDPKLRRIVRWAIERVHRELVSVGGRDRVALMLAALAVRLIEQLSDVLPQIPRRDELGRLLGGNRILDHVLRRGIEAIAWIVDERGLGGGRELDGLAWQLPLERLWEMYVEAVVRREAAETGGEVRTGRLGQTVFPIRWSDPVHRSLGHLVPDVVIQRGRTIQVVDAKYKAHLLELDDLGWQRFAEEAREAHRADVHQILAYAALYDADEITATLVYPLRHSTWHALRSKGRDVSRAELLHGGRRVHLELRGLQFGTTTSS